MTMLMISIKRAEVYSMMFVARPPLCFVINHLLNSLPRSDLY